MYKSISTFLEDASDKYGNKTALQIRRLFATQKFSYNDLYLHSIKIASYLDENGIKKGDKVLFWAPNMPEWTIAFLGTISGGVIAKEK